MVGIGLVPNDLSGARGIKPLGGTTIGLHLRHGIPPIMYKIRFK
jgi:hypothetical protein